MANRYLIGAAIAAFALSSVAKADVTFVGWGGSSQSAIDKTAVKPFVRKTGVKLRQDNYNGGIAQIRSQVETKNVSWDVVDMTAGDSTRACDEGLLEKINPADLAPGMDGAPAAKDFLPGGANGCVAGTIVWSTVLTYNGSKFTGDQPKTVSDFFDVTRFPGKRGLQKSPQGALEWALLADGVAPAEVYKTLATPAGQTRAFRKLNTIRNNIVWWESGSQPPQLLADGEVTMTSAYNGRIYDAITSDKMPFKFIWDGQLRDTEGFAIVKGTKNLKDAMAFVKFATSPEVLANQALLTAYGPMRKSSMTMVDPKVRSYLPTAPEYSTRAVTVDAAFWADHADDLNQKFAVWLANK